MNDILRLDERTFIADLNFRQVPGAIGTGVIEYGDGIAVVDPGPTVCLSALRSELGRAGYSLADIGAVLLTHIHLDHATAAGTIVREVPTAAVYVSSVGAPHMISPQRLLASAGRLYGNRMEALWGEFAPVPEGSVVQIGDGSTVELGDRRFEVACTPGHARHHVAFFEAATGTAWVGDDAGIRMRDGGPIPVAPPPDIDVEAWEATMARILGWRPDRIVPTHYGPVDAVKAHFDGLRTELRTWADRVRASLSDTSPDSERAAEFAAWAEGRLRTQMSNTVVDHYLRAFGPFDSWGGLARYWRKRGTGQTKG